MYVFRTPSVCIFPRSQFRSSHGAAAHGYRRDSSRICHKHEHKENDAAGRGSLKLFEPQYPPKGGHHGRRLCDRVRHGLGDLTAGDEVERGADAPETRRKEGRKERRKEGGKEESSNLY